MSTPGIGSVVIYHDTVGSGVAPFPAIVICTHDTWALVTNSGASYFGDQPTTSQVILAVLYPSGWNPGVVATEGTSAGEFSRVSLDLDLGSVSLGSVDLSSAVATNAVVPDV
jgi:hypothetical protein